MYREYFEPGDQRKILMKERGGYLGKFIASKGKSITTVFIRISSQPLHKREVSGQLRLAVCERCHDFLGMLITYVPPCAVHAC